jgi:hypothetical protein
MQNPYMSHVPFATRHHPAAQQTCFGRGVEGVRRYIHVEVAVPAAAGEWQLSLQLKEYSRKGRNPSEIDELEDLH